MIAIISQNGNAYTEGFVEEFWAGLFAYADDPGDAGKEAAVRGALTVDVTVGSTSTACATSA